MAADVMVTAAVSMVGLGKMGGAIAERILDAGHPLSVFNRTRERTESFARRGATVLASESEALAQADVCVSMLADDAALEAVLLGDDGVLAGARRGTVLIDMSTVSIAVSKRVAEHAARVGVAFLRAPVSGNPTVVRGGNLTIIVSGPKDAAADVDGILHAIGPNVRYVGEGEEARALKLILQILIGGTAELLSEALVLGEASGVDRATLLEVVGSSAAASPFVAYKTPPLLADDYSATFTTAMMLKDVDLILDAAAETDVSLPFTERLRSLLVAAAEHGYADLDFMALFLLLQETTSPDSTAITDKVRQ